MFTICKVFFHDESSAFEWSSTYTGLPAKIDDAEMNKQTQASIFMVCFITLNQMFNFLVSV